VIEREIAEHFLEEYVAVTKTDGYTWVGKLIEVTETSIVIENEEHGKSALSLEAIESIEPKGDSGG